MDIQMMHSALQELHYPIDKQQLMQEMELKGFEEGKALLGQLPDGQTFTSAEEVISKLPLQNAASSLGL